MALDQASVNTARNLLLNECKLKLATIHLLYLIVIVVLLLLSSSLLLVSGSSWSGAEIKRESQASLLASLNENSNHNHNHDRDRDRIKHINEESDSTHSKLLLDKTGRANNDQVTSNKRKRHHGPKNNIYRKSHISQWNLSHHVLCEPISQANDLKLSCPDESQFIVILEAYYSDLYPEIVCPKATSQEGKLRKLTGSQLISIFRQLYSPASTKASDRFKPNINNNNNDSNINIDLVPRTTTTSEMQTSLLNFAPTLAAYSNSNPFCLDDLKQSFAAKCSGRQRCRFSRHSDHQFPSCAQLKPGHLFVRYLCIDSGLLIKYCNADALLASHSSVLNRVKRESEGETESEMPVELGPDEQPSQVDTLDFGFVASPGYPMFYATPKGNHEGSDCSWTIEAEVGQRVTVKLLDASLAPNQAHELDSAQLNSELTVEEETARRARQLLLSSLRSSVQQQDTSASLSGLTQSGAKIANVHFDSLEDHESGRKITFRIDRADYDIIRSSVMDKFQKVESQCQGYDRLIIRDAIEDSQNSNEDEDGDQKVSRKVTASSFEGLTSEVMLSDMPTQEELNLVSQLPATLYRNQLIDFTNRTIFPQGARDKRIDYRALLDSLNPLELIWFYHKNVSLCSNSQQDQLSSEQQKNRISFTSSSRRIQLNLASGHMFNPNNRGVLFWYHKHGCAATLRAPSRSRIVHQNDTVEVFECYQGFIFNDTRQSQRIRRCSHLDQRWIDLDVITFQPIDFYGSSQRVPGCIYAGDLNSNQDPSWQPNEQNAQSQVLRPHQQPADEVAVEIVGVAPVSGNYIEPEVVIGLWNDEDKKNFASSSRENQASLAGLYDYPTNNSTVQTLLSIWHSLIGQSQESDEMRDIKGKNTDSQDIMTHQPLRERKLSGRDQNDSLWVRSAALLDRRLLVPAIVVLLLFLVINFVFYVIFLVALPKLVRCVCLRGPTADESPENLHKNESYSSLNTRKRKQNAYVNVKNSTLPVANNSKKSLHSSTLRSQRSGSNKLAYYESDYSVSMGMSL